MAGDFDVKLGADGKPLDDALKKNATSIKELREQLKEFQKQALSAGLTTSEAFKKIDDAARKTQFEIRTLRNLGKDKDDVFEHLGNTMAKYAVGVISVGLVISKFNQFIRESIKANSELREKMDNLDAAQKKVEASTGNLMNQIDDATGFTSNLNVSLSLMAKLMGSVSMESKIFGSILTGLLGPIGAVTSGVAGIAKQFGAGETKKDSTFWKNQINKLGMMNEFVQSAQTPGEEQEPFLQATVTSTPISIPAARWPTMETQNAFNDRARRRLQQLIPGTTGPIQLEERQMTGGLENSANKFNEKLASGMFSAADAFSYQMIVGGMDFGDVLKQQLLQGAAFFVSSIAKAGIGSLLGGGSFADILSGLFGFAEGGYTGSGGKYEVAGVAHRGEWVARASMVDHPIYGMEIARMEAIQRTMRGFADGGYAYSSPIPTINNNLNVSVRTTDREIAKASYRGQRDLTRSRMA